MDTQFIQWIIGQGGVAAVAGLSLFILGKVYELSIRLLQKTYEQWIESEKDKSTTLTAHNAQLMSTLEGNTRALAEMTIVIRSIADNSRGRDRRSPMSE